MRIRCNRCIFNPRRRHRLLISWGRFPIISIIPFTHSLCVEFLIAFLTCLFLHVVNLTSISNGPSISLNNIFLICGRIWFDIATLGGNHHLFHFGIKSQSSMYNSLLRRCSLAHRAASIDVLIFFSYETRGIQTFGWILLWLHFCFRYFLFFSKYLFNY